MLIDDPSEDDADDAQADDQRATAAVQRSVLQAADRRNDGGAGEDANQGSQKRFTIPQNHDGTFFPGRAPH